jgi:hypothetical protein
MQDEKSPVGVGVGAGSAASRVGVGTAASPDPGGAFGATGMTATLPGAVASGCCEDSSRPASWDGAPAIFFSNVCLSKTRMIHNHSTIACYTIKQHSSMF